jgi:hypothetical protein
MFILDIGGPAFASLPILAFEGATRRNIPNLQACQLSLFSVLKGWLVFLVFLKKCHILYMLWFSFIDGYVWCLNVCAWRGRSFLTFFYPLAEHRLEQLFMHVLWMLIETAIQSFLVLMVRHCEVDVALVVLHVLLCLLEKYSHCISQNCLAKL